MTEETRLKQKEIRKKFILARVYLNDSQNTLQSGGVRLATDGAYNAAELVMRAAILHKGETIPKRHGGIAQRFSLLFVKTGELPADLGGRIKEGLNLRNKSRYDEEAEITKKHAGHNIALAEELISFLEKELKTSNLQKSNSGLGLIGVLLIIGALIITAGGVVVWKEKVSFAPTPIPTVTSTPIPESTPNTVPSSPSPSEGIKDQDCNSECLSRGFALGYCDTLPVSPKVDILCGHGGTSIGEMQDCYVPKDKVGIMKSCCCVSGKGCAKDGERPTIFDLTTGKFVPDGKPCCKGLKAIGPKTPLESLNKGLCMEVAGSPGICRPCGDGICNPEYEDRCNCPEDCK